MSETIQDGTDTDWIEGKSTAPFMNQLADIGKALRQSVEDRADSVAGSFDFRTDRGIPHIVVYNGFHKEEGALGVQCVVNGDMSANAQLIAFKDLARRTEEAMLHHQQATFGGANRLVWRRLPDFGRSLHPDGLHLSLSVRFAWD